MNGNISPLTKIIAGSAVLFGIYLWSSKNNLKKTDRSKQFPMPVVSLIYVVAVIVFLKRILDTVNNALGMLDKSVDSLSEAIPAVAQISSQVVEPGIKQLTNTAVIALSIAIVVVFMLIKRVLISVFEKAFKPGNEFYDKVSEILFDLIDGDYLMKESTVQAKDFLKLIYWAAIAISVILLYLTMALFNKGYLELPFVPVLGLLIIGEIFYYIDGVPGKKEENKIAGEAEISRNIYNYRAMRKVLRGLFGDKLMDDDTAVSIDIMNPVSASDQIEKLIGDDSRAVETYGKFMDRYRRSGHALDQNYLASGLDLLKGKSVLFNNPFYYDLIPYAFYAMNHKLLQHKKVLVILGRHGIEADIEKWCENGLRTISNVEGLWRIGQLTDKSQDLDVGIISRSDVLNLSLHKENAAFFADTEYVVIIEPSKLITTAQIGLNSIIRYCNQDPDKVITFCSTDKNCDGLVDALSHMLMTSLSEVFATETSEGSCSYMCWKADGEYWQHRMLPNISRYLGVGTELSFTALKNQISKTAWYGGEKFPVTDMHWIVKQYYSDLLSYASLPESQEIMDKVFSTSANLWNIKKTKAAYLTVEDESNNVFEMKREFSTRSTEQSFVNIVSTPYLLCDYMTENKGIFNADSKAIPYIVADYVLTKRNILLRLCIQMSSGFVWAKSIHKELMMAGMIGDNDVAVLWKNLCECYKPIAEKADNDPLVMNREGREYSFTSDVIVKSRHYNVLSGVDEDCYSIEDEDFIHIVLGDLSNAKYIAEEENEDSYIGTELLGQIFQKYLPGQFLTLCGKYYEMLNVTFDGRIRLRRAADHITGRPVYRQIRQYIVHNAVNDPDMGSSRQYKQMKTERQYADISVSTPAYWNMPAYNDFAHAERIEINGVPERHFNNKSILKLTFQTEAEFSDNIRYTLTNLFNEVFRTVFAENQDMIVAVTPGEITDPLTYSISGEYEEFDSNAIYFIEDCQYDIGLITAVERNLNRIFRIICDYLQWNKESIENSIENVDEKAPVYTLTPEELERDKQKAKEEAKAERAKRNIFRRIIAWFKKVFRKKEKPEKETIDKTDEEAAKKPTDVTTEKSEEESMEEPTEVTAEEPTEESTEESVDEPKEEASEILTEESQESESEEEEQKESDDESDDFKPGKEKNENE